MTLREMYDKCKKLDPKIWIASYVLISVLVLYLYPPIQVSHFEINNSTTIATLENQYRTTLAQILGGGAVVIGIFFAWGNLKVALATLESNQNKARNELKLAQDVLKSDQNKAREELKLAQDTLEANMKIAQENLKVAQEGQITERFTRAVDQLQYFTNWIEKSFSFIPISKYFSVKCLKS